LPRPSSPVRAKASTDRPYELEEYLGAFAASLHKEHSRFPNCQRANPPVADDCVTRKLAFSLFQPSRDAAFFLLVEQTGFEPVTSALQERRSPS
jgi:hypothetical protein